MQDVTRLRRLSRLMQGIVLVCGALIALAVALFFFASLNDAAFFEEQVREKLDLSGPLVFTSSAVAITAALIAIQLGLLFAALYSVWRMFGAFSAEEPLSGKSAHWMGRASTAFVALAAGGILLRMLMILALTMGNPPGEKMLTLGFGSSELLTLLIACIMYMTGRLMAVAADVRAEQRDFV